MLDAARDAAVIVAGRTREHLAADMPLRRALVNALQEIGEAAARVSEEGRARVPALPWGQIVAARNSWSTSIGVSTLTRCGTWP
jgi:uncharacterized protein with HEPN domain